MSIPYTYMTNAPDEGAYFREASSILPEAIKEEFTRAPADVAYWGERYAEAVKAFMEAEQERKRVYAYTHVTLKSVAYATGTKITVDDLNAQVELDPQYQAAKMFEIEREAAKLAAKVRFDAVLTKRDMLVSLGAHIRAEVAPDSMSRRG